MTPNELQKMRQKPVQVSPLTIYTDTGDIELHADKWLEAYITDCVQDTKGKKVIRIYVDGEYRGQPFKAEITNMSYIRQ